MDKYTGKRLDSRYEIQELIGVGGMAMVYKAYDTVDDKTVAIKILKDEFLGNSEFIRRFKNESKAIAVLSHPNIVKVFDVSFGDKMQYIVMEYIDGITLKEYISHQHVIPWKEAVHFTVQILQALQHAHEKGIVHRDMKPQNIMLLQDGTIKVTDFGIARFFNNETRTMTDKAIGSVHYIAPEQARGDSTDGKADIYSVGVMLYEMLTGKLPFEADSAVSVAIMQMQTDPTPLRELNDKIPEGIEEITLKAMRKDPGQRYASASEMLDAIEIFRRNPSVKFRYSYFVDETPTKYVDSINRVPAAAPEPVYDDNYDSYDEDAEPNHSKTFIKILTLLVTLMVIAAIGVIVYMTVNARMKATEAKDVDVPQFVGQMYDELQANKSYKFNYEITAKYDDSKPVNVILSQDPEAGSKQVKENATIKLVINSKSTTKEVPNVRNYTEQEAIRLLEERYFNVNVVRVNSANDNKKGYVIGCSPQEGTDQEIGTTITLIVSDGVATEKELVPDVAGMTFDQAKQSVEAKGFTVQKSVIASSEEEGKVVNTDPLAGNSLTKGSLIIIQVSDGSRNISSMTQDVPMPEEYAEVKFTVYVEGKKDTEELIIPAVLTDLQKTIEIDPKDAKNGQKKVEIYIDDVRYMSYIFDFKNKTISQTYINNDYKIKNPEAVEGLNAAKQEAISDLEIYIDLDNDLSSKDSRTKARNVIADAKTAINEAKTKDEVSSLLSDAKSQLDEIEKNDDNSNTEKPPVEPEKPDPKPEESDELAQTRADAVLEITAYAKQPYYTDENWDKAELVLNLYEEKIKAAKTEGEIFQLIQDAKDEIDLIPKLSSGEPESSPT